jgi:hypothetical protein
MKLCGTSSLLESPPIILDRRIRHKVRQGGSEQEDVR